MEQVPEERRKRLRELSLHYCLHYKNIVRYNEPSCGKCAYSTYPKR